MSSALRIAALYSTNHVSTLAHSSPHQTSIPIVFSHHLFHLRWKPVQFTAINGHNNNVNGASDASFGDQKDSSGKENDQEESLTTNEIFARLKRYGISGLLSYGLLNTVYYLSTFLFVWLYVAPAPGRMGYLSAVERALALAPVVDRGLSWFTIKFKFESQGKAFIAIVWSCFGMAFMLFLIVTLLWA